MAKAEEFKMVDSRIPLEIVGMMSATDLRLALAKAYPEPVYEEERALNYIRGAMRCAAMLGLGVNDVSAMLSEWSRYDEMMMVGSLWATVAKKAGGDLMTEAPNILIAH